MTGLDLESFLHLLRADFGAWLTLGIVLVVLALMAWTSWGSRRALRKCLVLSVLAHVGLALYGGTVPLTLVSDTLADPNDRDSERIRRIEVSTDDGPSSSASKSKTPEGSPSSTAVAFDKLAGPLSLDDVKRTAPRLENRPEPIVPNRPTPTPLEVAAVAPELADTPLTAPEAREKPASDANDSAKTSLNNEPDPEDVPPVVMAEAAEPADDALTNRRLRPERLKNQTNPRRPISPLPTFKPSSLDDKPESVPLVAIRPEPGSTQPPERRPQAATGADSTAKPNQAEPSPAADDEIPEVEVIKGDAANNETANPSPPESNIRRNTRPDRTPNEIVNPRRPTNLGPLATARVNPRNGNGPSSSDILKANGGRPLSEVPEVYRSRLDPNRTALAYKAGANAASEQAVERALDWLARHQDADGRWDAATARGDDGRAVANDDDFTMHCPPGEICFGECAYWEADTALTGLSLLTYLGAGYTHTEGKYAATVAKGLEFLRTSQKPDGDLRGRSKAVGMYCHAMATIAICEAYALTGDPKLRSAAQRAIAFIVGARAKDGMAWRYAPGAPSGDTSILGWVVMALKSAKELDIPTPSNTQTGIVKWLGLIATGDNDGLGRYQPNYPVTATMTAEAWVCRQFLGLGGPGPASDEAATYLLDRGPKSETYNLYYWYYGTLALYQHGGAPWTRWNAEVRDELVRRQIVQGHPAGSWPPDESPYGTKGGRIYSTALATLTLEVYYRYLRLYDAPKLPATIAPAQPNRNGTPERTRR